jgi:hypothetical protein
VKHKWGFISERREDEIIQRVVDVVLTHLQPQDMVCRRCGRSANEPGVIFAPCRRRRAQ